MTACSESLLTTGHSVPCWADLHDSYDRTYQFMTAHLDFQRQHAALEGIVHNQTSVESQLESLTLPAELR
jgi:hypothetical protein